MPTTPSHDRFDHVFQALPEGTWRLGENSIICDGPLGERHFVLVFGPPASFGPILDYLNASVPLRHALRTAEFAVERAQEAAGHLVEALRAAGIREEALRDALQKALEVQDNLRTYVFACQGGPPDDSVPLEGVKSWWLHEPPSADDL